MPKSSNGTDFSSFSKIFKTWVKVGEMSQIISIKADGLFFKSKDSENEGLDKAEAFTFVKDFDSEKSLESLNSSVMNFRTSAGAICGDWRCDGRMWLSWEKSSWVRDFKFFCVRITLKSLVNLPGLVGLCSICEWKSSKFSSSWIADLLAEKKS